MQYRRRRCLGRALEPLEDLQQLRLLLEHQLHELALVAVHRLERAVRRRLVHARHVAVEARPQPRAEVVGVALALARREDAVVGGGHDCVRCDAHGGGVVTTVQDTRCAMFY